MALASVSVVIPCYRCADTVGRAVASVLAQTLPPSEIVLVDDGSDDATAAALEQLARSPIRVVSMPRNQGAASARNTGWDAAKERYVAFLDADDTWHARKLELQVRLMEQDPAIAASGHLHAVTLSALGDAVADHPQIVRIGFGDLLWSNRFITSSAMVRRELCVRFPDGQRYMEDQRLWLDAARLGHRIVRIEAALAAHHKADFGAGGLSANLAAMERAELGNYLALYRKGALGLLRLAWFTLWSSAKFVRRVLIVAARRLTG